MVICSYLFILFSCIFLERKENNVNDDYLIPRHVPPNSDCAFNPNYLVSEKCIPMDKNNTTYGKLNKPEKEVNSVKDNVKIFENMKNSDQNNKRTDISKEIKKNNKNLYVNA